MRFYSIILFAVLAFSCKTEQQNQQPNANNNVNTKPSPKTLSKIPVYGYEVVNTFKHDPRAFTQGLVYHEGFLYEGTGQEGRSSLRKVELESGKVLQKFDLRDDIFGEGISILGDKIFQVSWQEGMAWSYNVEDFKMLREFRYSGDGWGLTNDGANLLMSDGTHVIRKINPENFETIGTIPVFQENGQPLMKLNELEYVKGEIWANVWHSEEIGKPNHIARIDPKNGKLLGWIDLQGISPEDVDRESENTLNGIAYDEKTDRIFVTGKQWKRLFEIKLTPKS